MSVLPSDDQTNGDGGASPSFKVVILLTHTKHFGCNYVVRTTEEWNVFPDSYNLEVFKTKVNKIDV